MYVTGAGLWATDDATDADTDKPTHWKFLDRGLEETVIKGLVSPPAGPPLLERDGRSLRLPPRRPRQAVQGRDVRQSALRLGQRNRRRLDQAGDRRPRRLGQQPEVGRLFAGRRQDLDAVQDDAQESQGRGFHRGVRRRDGFRLGAARGAGRRLAGQGRDLGARRGAPGRGGLARLGAGAVPSGRRSREPQEVLRPRRQGRPGLHQRRRRSPLHRITDGLARAGRLSVQLRLGGRRRRASRAMSG